MPYIVETDRDEYFAVIESVKAVPYGNTVRFSYDGTYGIFLCESYEEAVKKIRNTRVFSRAKILSKEEGKFFAYEDGESVMISAGKVSNIFKI